MLASNVDGHSFVSASEEDGHRALVVTRGIILAKSIVTTVLIWDMVLVRSYHSHSVIGFKTSQNNLESK